MITKMGNASAIRKAFVAFKTAFVTNPFVVLSFEKKINPDICNGVAMKFGGHLSPTVMSLPQGVFNLSKEFYETDSITVKAGSDHSFETYPSIGAYADSLDYGTGDYLDSEYWLGVIAGLLCDSFLNENIPFPSKENLERMFLVGDNYADMQKSLQHAFSIAKEQDKLEDMLLDAMGEYHKLFVDYAAKKLVKNGPETDADAPLKRIYSMLPLEIVSHVSVGAIYDGFLPVILASGVFVDQEKLFRKRVERGRVFLKEFIGKEYTIEQTLGVLTEAIFEKPKDLQPLLPDYLVDDLRDEATCVQLATVLIAAVLSEETLDLVPPPIATAEDLVNLYGCYDDEEEEE